MKISFGGGFAMVAVLVLSACAARLQPAPVEDVASWTDITSQKTLVQISPESMPVNLNDILSNERDLRSALDTLFPEAANIENLGERISFIRGEKSRSSESRIELLRGLGGIIAHNILDAAQATLNDRGAFNPDVRVYTFSYGKLDDYQFDEIAGSGRLLNTTYFTTVTVPLGSGAIISKTDSYRWDVNVDPGGFTVVRKENSHPNDPFPGTLEFSPAMLNRINALGFQYKLWAKGTAIEIVKIEFKPDGALNYTEVPHSDPRYDRTPENCVDMLFVDRPPPVLGTLQPPLYCLGRCANPALINTGI